MDEDDESVAPELTPEELKVRRLKKNPPEIFFFFFFKIT